ncbi:MAG: prenyltransferase, partial [Nitrososphaerota archaeon]
MDDGTVARPFVHGQQAASDAQSAEVIAAIGRADHATSFAAPSGFTIWIRLVRPSALLLVLLPALTALALLWIRGATIQALPALSGIVSLLLVQAGASLLDVFLEYARRLRLPESERHDQLTARALLGRSPVYPIHVLRVSILLLALGICAGIPLITAGGWPVMLLGIAGLAVAFLFSATTFMLKQFSLADLIIGLALGPGVVIGMMLAQHHTPTSKDLLFAGALGLLAMLPAEGAHLRDADVDRRLGRHTFVTMLGDGVGKAIYVLTLLAALTLLALAALPLGAPHGALLGFFALPAYSIPVSGLLRARPGHARGQIIGQELRAYALFTFWFLLGLVINAILLNG